MSPEQNLTICHSSSLARVPVHAAKSPNTFPPPANNEEIIMNTVKFSLAPRNTRRNQDAGKHNVGDPFQTVPRAKKSNKFSKGTRRLFSWEVNKLALYYGEGDQCISLCKERAKRIWLRNLWWFYDNKTDPTWINMHQNVWLSTPFHIHYWVSGLPDQILCYDILYRAMGHLMRRIPQYTLHIQASIIDITWRK